MKNNKGFTLIEIITTFALLTAIIVILINIIIIIKNLYVKYELKTELLIEQANLSIAMNSKIDNNSVISLSPCTDVGYKYCYNLTINSEGVELRINDDKIIFGDYIYKLSETSSVGMVEIIDDIKFLNIKIPIENKFYPGEDFGINLVYLYK